LPSGGNTDVRQLVAGSRLQLPVYVPGARFSAGDGHMAQGDGEISGTGLETLMSATLRFGIIKDTIISGPRAIVPAADPTQLAMASDVLDQGYYITTGAGPDLMENAKNAVREMIDWLVVDRRLSLHEAYVLCSVAGDLKISETVDLPNWIVSTSAGWYAHMSCTQSNSWRPSTSAMRSRSVRSAVTRRMPSGNGASVRPRLSTVTS
jgi:acetamidase/formamidase